MPGPEASQAYAVYVLTLELADLCLTMQMHLARGSLRIDIVQLSEVIHRDPEIMSGKPVFVGTRVPVYNLFDYLEAGDSLEEFLASFPSVRREQAVAALELAKEAVLELASSDRRVAAG